MSTCGDFLRGAGLLLQLKILLTAIILQTSRQFYLQLIRGQATPKLQLHGGYHTAFLVDSIKFESLNGSIINGWMPYSDCGNND